MSGDQQGGSGHGKAGSYQQILQDNNRLIRENFELRGYVAHLTMIATHCLSNHSSLGDGDQP